MEQGLARNPSCQRLQTLTGGEVVLAAAYLSRSSLLDVRSLGCRVLDALRAEKEVSLK